MSLDAILWLGLSSGICSSLLFFLSGRLLLSRLSRELPLQLQSLMDDESVQRSIKDKFDDFVRLRLGQALPVLNMFIDDKLIEELKPVFMEEVTRGIPDLAGNDRIVRKMRNILSARMQKISVRLIPLWVTAHILCAYFFYLIY